MNTINYKLNSPSFKQISITDNGQKAIDRTRRRYIIEQEIEKANHEHPNTKYWNLVIDGEKEYDKHLGKFVYNLVFKHISKITGETFENLMIHPATGWGSGGFHVCSSKNHKYLPYAVLLLSNDRLVSDNAKSKELLFDVLDSQEADRIFERQYNSLCDDIFVYKALEDMSAKYETSLKIGVDEFLKTNPKYKKDMKEVAKLDHAVWFSDGGIDQWT